MGEGAGLFVLKRLEQAELDGDRTPSCAAWAAPATARARASPRPTRWASDSRSARLAQLRALARAVHVDGGLRHVDQVGDVVEVESLMDVFAGAGVAPGSVALGSVKSNIGHLKAAAGAAGLLKATLALHHKVLPAQPQLRAAQPEPGLVRLPSPSTPSCATGRCATARRASRASAPSASAAPTSTSSWRSTCPDTRQPTATAIASIAVPAPPRSAPVAARPKSPLRGRSCSAPTTRKGSPTSCARAGRGPPGPPPRAGATERRGAARARSGSRSTTPTATNSSPRRPRR